MASVLELDGPGDVPPYNDPNDDMTRYLNEDAGPWVRDRFPDRTLDHRRATPLSHLNVPPGIEWIAFYDLGDPYRHAVVMRGACPVWDPEREEDLDRLRNGRIRHMVFVVDADGGELESAGA